ncbi:MAG TPA: FkbM family methyltransferase [Xanthobacteraceae bacterium]|jgi:FkbM family methyltransferase|nr:FkbM family methyltransferase [Xanthobacteraceae bacterium]
MIETIHDHTVHPRYLGSQSHVLDLGANYGLFAKAVTARFGCRCIAVEPSPEPFAAIVETSLISKLQAAAASQSGTVPFHIAPDSVFNSLYRTSEVIRVIEVPAISFPDLFDLVGVSPLDLLKMDIEGAEIELLNTCPPSILQQIRQINVEFHDHCDLTPASEVRSTLARLHRLGFFSVRMSRNGHHDTWLINRNLCDISTAELKFIEYIAPTWMGIRRVARRQLKRVLQRPSGSCVRRSMDN